MPNSTKNLYGLLGLAIGAVSATLVCLQMTRQRYQRPALELNRLTRKMAHDEIPESFAVHGDEALEEVAQHLASISMRVSDLKQMRRDEEFNLNVLLENMFEGVMVVDRNHTIQLVNRELVALFSIRGNPVQRTTSDALRQSSVEVILTEAISTGTALRREVTLDQEAAASSLQCFEMSAVPIRTSDGKIDGAVAVFHDISRIKQLESVRQEFVANVSHELRTPLSIFRGYLETLLEQPHLEHDKIHRILETMQRHSNRLNALVEDLLTLTRLESKQADLHLTSVRLSAFIRQLVADWEQRFAAAPAQIHFAVPDDLPSLEIDTTKFAQVLLNLMENAVAYSNAPREITIGASVLPDHQMEITVADRGIGIPAGDLAHIFERFYRVDRGRSRASGGTGLGLSIVKHIMQIHNGSVDARSEVGKGTTIILRLPIETHHHDDPPIPSKE